MEEMIKNPYTLFAENQETYEEAVKKVPMRANHFNVPNISVWIPQELILCVSFPWHQPSNQTVLTN